MRQHMSCKVSAAEKEEFMLFVNKLPHMAFCQFSFLSTSKEPVRSKCINGLLPCQNVGLEKGMVLFMQGTSREGLRGSTRSI